MIHSHIRLHMKQNLTNQYLSTDIQYPQVGLMIIFVVIFGFHCRIFANEKWILSNAKMLKICDVFFILVNKKQNIHLT